MDMLTNQSAGTISDTSFDFYSKSEYLIDISRRIASTKSGGRIALATMSFEPQYPEIRAVVDELGKAATRGVTVSLAIDAFVFLKGRDKLLGPLFYHAKLPKELSGEFHQKFQLLEELRAKGVSYAITNQPKHAFSNPVAGRSHIKFAIINDRVYVGGCNLNEPENVDIMVGWNAKMFADQLYEFSQRTITSQGTAFMNRRDRVLELEPAMEGVVFIDAGRPRQSIILDQALQLIDQAHKKLLISCQFFPNSTTAHHLLQAHRRGVDVTILFNHPSKFQKHGQPLQYLNVAFEHFRMPAKLFASQLPKTSPYLHAKVIATESAAMVGSHNHIAAGVNFGTAEIALLRRDPIFANAVTQKINAEIAKN